MREALPLFRPAAEGVTKRRLWLALAHVASGAVLAAAALAQCLAAGGTADIGSSRIEAVPPACAKCDGGAGRGVAEHSNAPILLVAHLPDALDRLPVLVVAVAGFGGAIPIVNFDAAADRHQRRDVVHGRDLEQLRPARAIPTDRHR